MKRATDKVLRSQIGVNIRRIREARGMTRRAFEIKTGISPFTLLKWERGECSPDLDAAVCLSRALDVPVSRFIAERDRPGAVTELVDMLLDAAEVEGQSALGNLLRDAAEQICVLEERIAIMTEDEADESRDLA